MRVGFGYDVHKFVKDRKLIIGGVEIDYEYGLAGHSDADVLTHAIMDALLGAAGLGDIGEHFPDNELAYKDADSIILLKAVGDLLEEKNYFIENIDCIVVAQQPKLFSYKVKMKENIATALKIDIDRINIKATTEEGLGFTGNLEGISAKAVCLIENMYDFESSNSCGGCCCENK